MKAQPHPQQAERLKTLQAYEVLDSEPEDEFDDITRLAAAICGTSISVINLIDNDRQWFKSEVGLGVRETPLDTSICSHVILESDFVEIPDTLEDARMKDNELCLGDPGLRFYAGALLRADNGLPLGTLCVLDWQPRSLTALQREALRLLARQVMQMLDLRRSLKQAEILRREVDHRVKNSLQSVAALIRLQARDEENPAVSEALRNVVQRIETVAALHEQLYRTDAGSHVDLAEYLDNIGGFLRETCPEHIRLSVDVDALRIDSRRAAAVAVIVNESTQNAISHAFPEGQIGQIKIAGAMHGDDEYCLRLSDDGVGYMPDVGRPGGLGLRVIQASCAQLSGEMRHMETEQGSAVEIIFPISD